MPTSSNNPVIDFPQDSTLKEIASQFTIANALLTTIAASNGDILDVKNWASIRNIVRMGLGAKFFPVGYEFTTHDSDENTEIIWVVRGHDHHKAADKHIEHTMTLEMKYGYSNSAGAQKTVQFDRAEALYFAENGLAAGTYHFTAADQHFYPSDNGKTYQFTLTQDVPAGGQIVLNATHSTTLEGKSVKTYANPSATEALETAAITIGSSGTNLGTTGETDGMNHLIRALLGSNNYAQSALDQWLNSDKTAGSVWKPTNKFDRPPTWVTTHNGFVHGLPTDFLAVVQPAVIPCRTNSIYETNSLDGTEFTVNQSYELTRKFFLLSRPEVFGTWDNANFKDGELIEYYDELTNAERIPYDAAGTAISVWLRSTYTSIPSQEYRVENSGKLVNGGTNVASISCFKVACIIG